MGEGDVTLSATATDKAGNTSEPTTRPITVDTLTPNVPVINAVATDDIINSSETSTTITGTAEADATVALTIGGNVRTITSDGSGEWSYELTADDLSAMGEGDVTLSATATDAVGNISESTTRSITVDTLAPEAPVINAVATDDIIDHSELSSTITGTAEAGATIELTIDAGDWAKTNTITGNNLGTWEYTLTAEDITVMGEGLVSLSATATDAAGNTSEPTERSITVDTVETINTSIVVFDLVGGTSSSHSDRTFDADPATSYKIYIKVNSTSSELLTDENSEVGTWGLWEGAKNLGDNDRIIFVGTGSNIVGAHGAAVAGVNEYNSGSGVLLHSSSSSSDSWAVLFKRSDEEAHLWRNVGGIGDVRLFTSGNFDFRLDDGTSGALYATAMPAGVLTSQGLAPID
jgi:hypothetical protein